MHDVFDRLRSASVIVEKYADKFARSKNFGYVTNLGKSEWRPLFSSPQYTDSLWFYPWLKKLQFCNLYQGINNLLEAEANASKTAPIKNTKSIAATTSHSNSSSSKKNHGDSFLTSEHTLTALKIGSAALWVYLVLRL